MRHSKRYIGGARGRRVNEHPDNFCQTQEHIFVSSASAVYRGLVGGQFSARHGAPIVSGEIRPCGSVACAGRNATLFLPAAARGKRPDTEMVRAAIRPSYQRSQGAIAKPGGRKAVGCGVPMGVLASWHLPVSGLRSGPSAHGYWRPGAARAVCSRAANIGRSWACTWALRWPR